MDDAALFGIEGDAGGRDTPFSGIERSGAGKPAS
jgi:hypothetical protein